MKINIKARNKVIYAQYNSGIPIEYIAELHGLKTSTIRGIVNNYKKSLKDGDKLMDEFYRFMKENHNCVAYNIICRYFSKRDIVTIEDRYRMLSRIDHFDIDGLGPKSIKAIKEFISLQKL